MDFEIPEELKMVQSLVRDFVNDQLKPMERDILGRAADLSDARVSLPSEVEGKLVKLAKEMGLWVVAYEELGAEAVRRLEVEDFPATVVNDVYGGDLYQEGKAKYRID